MRALGPDTEWELKPVELNSDRKYKKFRRVYHRHLCLIIENGIYWRWQTIKGADHIQGHTQDLKQAMVAAEKAADDTYADWRRSVKRQRLREAEKIARYMH